MEKFQLVTIHQVWIRSGCKTLIMITSYISTFHCLASSIQHCLRFIHVVAGSCRLYILMAVYYFAVYIPHAFLLGVYIRMDLLSYRVSICSFFRR